VAEPLFLLADAAIVGPLGTTPLGGLGVASQALTTLVGIAIFLAYGTTAAVARQLGAGRRGHSSAAGHRRAVAGRHHRRNRASRLLAGTGVLRGLPDTRTPLAVAVAANLANVALNAVLVLRLRWGVAESAWGTVLAQTGAAVAYLAMVARGARRAGVPLRPDRAGLRAAAGAGASLVVRTLALQAMFIVATAIAARQGNAAITAHQVALRIWTLLAFALDAIAIAGQAITGKCLGAGDVAGARAATTRMIFWGVVYGIVFGILLAAAIPLLPGIFSPAPAVRRLLGPVLLIAAAQQPVAGVAFVLDGVLIGAGDQDYLALAGLAAAAVFAVAAMAVVAAHGGLVALWLAFSLWLLARFGTLTPRARGARWLVTGAVRR
jgi:putative MATE family efflux protein